MNLNRFSTLKKTADGVLPMPKIEVENVLTKNAEFMEEAKKNIVRSIVQSVSRGNVNLQLGRYITEIDKEKMRQQVIAYKIKAKIDQD